MTPATRIMTILGTLCCSLAFATVALAGKPGAQVTLDLVKGKKGSVTFEHTKHTKEFKNKGAAITCKDCHHTAKSEKNVKPCSKCHVAEGGTQVEHGGKKARFLATSKGGKIDKKSIIFHTSCIKCHKANKTAEKRIDKCKACHKK